METIRVNNINNDDIGIFSISVFYEGFSVWNKIPRIVIEKDCDTNSKPYLVLDRVINVHNGFNFYSKDKSNLDKKEHELLKMLQEHIKTEIKISLSSISNLENSITDMKDALTTLSFREEKIKRILSDD